MTPTNLFTQFLLLFCKKRYQIQHDLFDKKVEYKRLFRKIYVLREWYLLPTHQNCRCITIPVKELTFTNGVHVISGMSSPTEWTPAPEDNQVDQ